MGSPEFALPTLEHLVLDSYDVVAVCTRPDKPAGRGRGMASSPVKRLAQTLALPVIQPASLKDKAAITELVGYKPDVIIVAAFGQILSGSVLELPKYGCINIHPSLLPQHRGASPVAASILAGDSFTGVSIMLMDEGLDTGPVLAQAQIPVMNNDTTGLLTLKLSVIAAHLLQDVLPNWIEGKIEPRPQAEAGATYSAAITKDDGEIDWCQPAMVIWRRVRAFQPWPGCYTRWRGRLLKVIEAEPLYQEREAAAGGVVVLPGGGVGVGTGDGILRLLTLQLEGKRVMAADDFLRGQRGYIGVVLGG
ncbi:MAG TPA: methionyl-tRNA formyltransferase [Dehalococcoidia bacterium]|nr:methionyl-tRNA formyltransferase [Dehalococcoidia bacterium]